MPICVVVLNELGTADQLKQKIQQSNTPLINCQLIKPFLTASESSKSTTSKPLEETQTNQNEIQTVEIDSIPLLNPTLSRNKRQKDMALWLMPFGFIAGLAFSKMTSLSTFSQIGAGPIEEALLGGFLGMGSGLIGSFAAAASVNTDKNDDLASLRKLYTQGKSLIILETPFETELPWKLVQDFQPIKVIRISQL